MIEVTQRFRDLRAHEGDVGDVALECGLAEVESERFGKLGLTLDEQLVERPELGLAPVGGTGAARVERGPGAADGRVKR